MNYRRGFFRAWIVATVGALIVAPIWRSFDQVGGINSACFEIVEVKLAPPAPSATENAGLAAVRAEIERRLMKDPTICTAVDDDHKKLFESTWKEMTSLKVSFGFGNDKKVITAIPWGFSDHSSLYFAVTEDLRQRVAKDVRGEIPLIEGFIAIVAILIWWAGRFCVLVGIWIARGFRAREKS